MHQIVRRATDLRRNGKVFARASQHTDTGAIHQNITFAELAEHFPEDKIPFLDRADVDESTLTPLQRQWRDSGFILIPRMISPDLIQQYNELRQHLNLGKAHFSNFNPYIDHDIIRKITLSPKMHEVLTEILGQDMAIHFILSAYHSTERGWHQDDYLNPDYVYSNYCAAWISLGDISPDAGPFEFIEGSHKWPCVRRHLVQRYLSDEQANITDASMGKGHWAEFAEVFTNEAYVKEIESRDIPVSQFLGEPGDVLIWHGRLVHRGSAPNNSGLSRPAMISHFSGKTVRSDIGTDIRRYGTDGGYYWHFGEKDSA